MNVAEMRELLAKATPGPWHRDRDEASACGDAITEWDAYICDETGKAVGEVYPDNSENGALIVAAVNNLPALLDVAEAAERLGLALNEMHTDRDWTPERVSRAHNSFDAARAKLSEAPNAS